MYFFGFCFVGCSVAFMYLVVNKHREIEERAPKLEADITIIDYGLKQHKDNPKHFDFYKQKWKLVYYFFDMKIKTWMVCLTTTDCQQFEGNPLNTNVAVKIPAVYTKCTKTYSRWCNCEHALPSPQQMKENWKKVAYQKAMH